ncbi:U-box domain-containing protein 13 isoform X1 [Physcomitrium patens]|uniref:U-box domain-containing protein 12 n=2 Tax=Physcomitrium patens TaxID=3218 RepID=A0A2K1J288_PHYPA|nr:U-box domain-containing protein 13-like [Physcomitrium patens]PNR35645.1 hypothetical protein PHYPA_021495 [Physcomitrium patens]|eukprot:XP_024401002.1 U-box domain-containing protein 13-like [Physcomitrella patens]
MADSHLSQVQLIQSLIDVVNTIGLKGDYIKSHKKECALLTRRVKLLAPLFEELRESRQKMSYKTCTALHDLEEALQSANKLLQMCHDGSKLYLVLERQAAAEQFDKVNADLECALDALPYDQFASDEVKEQVDLVRSQLKRAKGRVDNHDSQIHSSLVAVLHEKEDSSAGFEELQMLAEKLELRTPAAIRQENQALQEMMLEKQNLGDDNHEQEMCFQQLFTVLRKLTSILPPEESDEDTPELDRVNIAAGVYVSKATKHHAEIRAGLGIEGRGSQISDVESAGAEKAKMQVVPDDFKCPISLDLMKDPVIVATGQTYERACIQRWLDSGHKTCPKTGVLLTHLGLTPNYSLRSVIAQWCESVGMEVPNQVSSKPKPSKLLEYSSGERATVEHLLLKLRSGQADMQRAAAGELRLLAKRNVENRVCIAEAGAIPLLIGLLSTEDLKTQEHAVTALLNLSINDANKGIIVNAGAIKPIVEVLKNGSKEARENAAATLFSLSVVDENKVTIGSLGAIPALVDLLKDGTARGKKDAATALFNLSIYQGNKARAVRAGVVPPLMDLLRDPSAGMVDEALAILAILATHPDGRLAIGQASALPILVDLIKSGSPRNKENAVAITVNLATHDPVHLVTTYKLGAQDPLRSLVNDGTPRAKRKAAQLLENMRKQLESTQPFTGSECCT